MWWTKLYNYNKPGCKIPQALVSILYMQLSSFWILTWKFVKKIGLMINESGQKRCLKPECNLLPRVFAWHVAESQIASAAINQVSHFINATVYGGLKKENVKWYENQYFVAVSFRGKSFLRNIWIHYSKELFFPILPLDRLFFYKKKWGKWRIVLV